MGMFNWGIGINLDGQCNEKGDENTDGKQGRFSSDFSLCIQMHVRI